MSKVFIIEDDRALLRELSSLLELDGYESASCSDFEHADAEALAAEADLVVLDLRLPQASGLAICRSIRQESDVPILVLTSSDDEFDEVMSMRLGADDYVAKPYRPAVLLAHVARLVERAGQGSSPTIEYAGISLDAGRSTASFGERTVELTRNETCILAELVRARGKIVSRQDLMVALWQTDEFLDDNTLTVNVNRLRRTLESLGAPKGALKTHRGQGYSL